MSGCQGKAAPDLYRSARACKPALDSALFSRHFLPSASNRSPPKARRKPTMPSLADVLLIGGRMPYTVVRPPSLLVRPLARVLMSSKVHVPSPDGILRPAFSTMVRLM